MFSSELGGFGGCWSGVVVSFLCFAVLGRCGLLGRGGCCAVLSFSGVVVWVGVGVGMACCVVRV